MSDQQEPLGDDEVVVPDENPAAAAAKTIKCTKCNRRRAAKYFAASRIRANGRLGICRQCAYRVFVVEKMAKSTDDERLYKRIGSQLAKRERARGVRPAPNLNAARIKQLVDHFERRSAIRCAGAQRWGAAAPQTPARVNAVVLTRRFR